MAIRLRSLTTDNRNHYNSHRLKSYDFRRLKTSLRNHHHNNFPRLKSCSLRNHYHYNSLTLDRLPLLLEPFRSSLLKSLPLGNNNRYNPPRLRNHTHYDFRRLKSRRLRNHTHYNFRRLKSWRLRNRNHYNFRRLKSCRLRNHNHYNNFRRLKSCRLRNRHHNNFRRLKSCRLRNHTHNHNHNKHDDDLACLKDLASLKILCTHRNLRRRRLGHWSSLMMQRAVLRHSLPMHNCKSRTL